ncbi:MAG: pyridoxamine 5'-phosphate oxidase family protein, partial [Nocardia sp.]|nr:pyridoxamine 5'-phosphate oxidase family protein [Nocardia sp.]
MASWREFAEVAPRISATFVRRHAAAGNLCLLATTRRDGYPRICPLEPRLFEGRLWLVGMPGTAKFRDLRRDPRFCLHTATVDPQVGDGDAKLWGTVYDVPDPQLQQRWKQELFDDTGFDLRAEHLDPFLAADIIGAS